MLSSNYLFTNYIYIYIYKQDLALNNIQRLICHKKHNQLTIYYIHITIHYWILSQYVSQYKAYENEYKSRKIPNLVLLI